MRATAGSSRSSPWSWTSTLRPAESRPRTSSRSSADSACWIEVPTSIADQDGRSPTSSRTPVAVGRRSRATAHRASLSRSSDALASSRERPAGAPCASRTASTLVTQSPATALTAAVRAATSRSRTSRATPSGPRSSWSSASSRPAATCEAATGSPSPSDAWSAARRSSTSEGGRSRRAPGPRRRAMMPHTSGGGLPEGGPEQRTGGISPPRGPPPRGRGVRRPPPPAHASGPRPSRARAAPYRSPV